MKLMSTLTDIAVVGWLGLWRARVVGKVVRWSSGKLYGVAERPRRHLLIQSLVLGNGRPWLGATLGWIFSDIKGGNA